MSPRPMKVHSAQFSVATRGKGTVMVACACVGRALLNLSAALLALGLTPEQVEAAAKGASS